MKNKEINKLSNDELENKLNKLKKDLFNMRFKKNNGQFILRIDDTDKSRSTKEYENKIKENLSWLGLNWDKTFNQSERIDLYNIKIETLKNDGRLYPCFETAEELSLKKKSTTHSF